MKFIRKDLRYSIMVSTDFPLSVFTPDLKAEQKVYAFGIKLLNKKDSEILKEFNSIFKKIKIKIKHDLQNLKEA